MGSQIEELLKPVQRRLLKQQNPIKGKKEDKMLSSKSEIKD